MLSFLEIPVTPYFALPYWAHSFFFNLAQIENKEFFEVLHLEEALHLLTASTNRDEGQTSGCYF